MNTGKSKIGLILFILSLILIGAGTFLLFNKGESKTVVNNKSKVNSEKSITSKTVENYNIELETIWINKAVGITYNIPKSTGPSLFNGSTGFPYMHGHSFQYGNGYVIYVDKSLEGHKNLETLASDIIGEKKSDKYKEVYNFGSSFLRKFSNKKTSKIKIGNFDTIYFESEDLETRNEKEKMKLIGYSFVYEDEYISVYGEVPSGDEKTTDILNKRLQYVINSIKVYNGESFAQLKGNAREYYDNGFNLYFCNGSSNDKDCSKNNFAMNFLSSHTLNGVLRSYTKDPLVKLDSKKLNWNGKLDGILDATINQKVVNGYPAYYTATFPWVNYNKNNNKWTNNRKFEKLKEENLTVNDVKFKKYVVRIIYPSNQKGYIVTIYTFIYDNVPYVFSYRLDETAYDRMGGKENLSGDQVKIITAQTEAVSDSYILTFRTFKGEDYSTYVKLF